MGFFCSVWLSSMSLVKLVWNASNGGINFPCVDSDRGVPLVLFCCT